MIKVYNKSENSIEIMNAVNIFRAKIIDYSSDALCIEVTGDSEKIDAFVEVLKPVGIIELCRTGIVALERGSNSLLSK